MDWGKVIGKFLKGVIIGGVSATVPHIPTIITGTGGGSIQEGSTIALVVGLCNALVNWLKHRQD